MKSWKMLALVGLGIMYSGTALAAPSHMGTTGAILTPTAEVVGDKHFSVSYHRDIKDNHNIATGTVGVSKRAELSLAHRFGGYNKSFFSGKYALTHNTVAYPAIAVGVVDVGNSVDVSPYIVATKALPLDFKLSLGVGKGQYDGVFGSLEKNFSLLGSGDVFPATSLILEYDTKDWNYGARVAIAEGAKATVGHFNDRTYVGVSFEK